jgi:hypothetical protein
MKRCHFAQGLHRENLGDEDSARSVLRGVDPHAMKYSPTLHRQMQLGVAPRIANAPQAPGLGGAAAGQARAPKKSDKKDEE